MNNPGVTTKQTTLFAELLDRKQFPAGNDDTEALRAKFATLSRKAASNWIDHALALPNLTEAEDDGADIPAPF